MSIEITEKGIQRIEISGTGRRLLEAERVLNGASELVRQAMLAHLRTIDELRRAIAIRDEAQLQFVRLTESILKEVW